MNIKNTVGMDNEYVEVIQAILEDLSYDMYQLNLTGFKGIEIVNDSLLYSGSDGCTVNKLIQLPKRKTERYIDQGNLDIIKSTIFHELVHVSLSNQLPIIHREYDTSISNDNYIKIFTIILYIEYVAHKYSSKYESIENQRRFYNSVNERIWDFNDAETRVYFIKVAGYILGRDKNNKYLNQILNTELKTNLLEIKPVLDRIGLIPIIDDYMVLSPLEIIVQKYIKN